MIFRREQGQVRTCHIYNQQKMEFIEVFRLLCWFVLPNLMDASVIHVNSESKLHFFALHFFLFRRKIHQTSGI